MQTLVFQLHGWLRSVRTIVSRCIEIRTVVKGGVVTKGQKWTVVMIITIVWAFSIIAPAFIKGYKPPPEIHSGFPMIIGALLAYPARREGSENEEDQTGTENGRHRRSDPNGGDDA